MSVEAYYGLPSFRHSLPFRHSVNTAKFSLFYFCRAESASANEFERFPRGERKERGETSTHRPVALGAWSWGLVSLCSPFCAWILYSRFVAIYNISYVCP